MQLGLDLNVSMKLEQKLSPQMIQSLKLLQVTALQLEAMVTQELETNPMLEQKDEGDDSEPIPEESLEILDSDSPEAKEEAFMDVGAAENKKEEVDWDKFYEDGFDPGFKKSEEQPNPDQSKFERIQASSKNLQDLLLEQLQFHRYSKEARPIIEFIINSLDDDGYLKLESLPNFTENQDDSAAMVEVYQYIGFAKELHDVSPYVREAFHVLYRLDPAGLGARDLRECLLLQMDRKGVFDGLPREIVENSFGMLEKLKISALAKKYETTPEAIQEAISVIGKYEPKPGRLLYQETASTVIPDLLVEVEEGETCVYFNEKFLPSLKIATSYQKLLKKESRVSTDEKKFIRDKLGSATWLIRAIEQRKTTMLKVMHAIVQSQPDFFSKGATHLKPLILQDIADRIGMHISTVSRVINGKYVQTPHGIFELKYFFTSSVAQEDGEDVSSIKIKEAIRDLISKEDPKRPLSDQKIAETLKKNGLDVARRTVAKYRDYLELLPARLRKKF